MYVSLQLMFYLVFVAFVLSCDWRCNVSCLCWTFWCLCNNVEV